MAIHIYPRLLRRKWVLLGVGLPILVALWWGFRPEKLWINQRVNEAAPFDASGDPQPILTGRFDGNARQANGRATIYRKPGGEEYLQLKDFTAPSGANVHVVLARSQHMNPAQSVVNGGLDGVDLGPLRGDQSDQIYDLPAGADLTKYDAVAIYGENDHTVFGRAKLEPF